jgi:hypothetical protein
MKIRNGFVSNSSSSSFVCELCGESVTGMDIGLSDCEMFKCVNGHIICQSEAVESFDEWVNEHSDLEAKGEGSGEDVEYEVPEKYCPFCCMIEFTQSDLKRYLRKKFGIGEDEVFATVKAANKRRKKLYDSEYVMYVLTNKGISMEAILAEIKGTYKTYAEFKKVL